MTTDPFNLQPAFHFRVTFLSPPYQKGNVSLDSAFEEVSGIETKFETEDIVEGGENRFVHRLPLKVSHGNLMLKRGIAPSDSMLVQWCRAVFEGGLNDFIQPADLTVSLLDECGMAVRSWDVVNAYPVTWDVEPFNATKNEIAIEKMELSYNYSKRVD